MMAVQAGASHVTACEAVASMAAVATQVSASHAAVCNTAAIEVIAKRSTELPASLHKADLIVTEIFDTDLLGDAVLGSVADAMARLASPTGTVIPAGATVYVQPVQSDLLASWDTVDLDTILRTAAAAAAAATVSAAGTAAAFATAFASMPTPTQPTTKCAGRGQLYDLHVDVLAPFLTVLAPPTPVLSFDFAKSAQHAADVKADRATRVTPCVGGGATIDGRVDALVVWWILHLDIETVISTAPAWVDPGNAAAQWRDHWLQVFFSCCIKQLLEQNSSSLGYFGTGRVFAAAPGRCSGGRRVGDHGVPRPVHVVV